MSLNFPLELSVAALELAADEVFILDPTGRVVFVNHATCEKLGYSDTELQAMSVWDWDPKVTPESWAATWDELIAKRSLAFETLHIKKSGEVFPCRIQAHLFDLNGQPHILAFVEDRSRFEQLASDLYQQKQRLELVLKGTGLGLWDWNPQTGDVVFDERWCEMLGYTLSEIPANVESWSSRVHPDDIEGCFADIQAHIQGEVEYYSNTHRMKHKDGRWIYILDRGQVMERDQEGNPIRFTGSHEDITESILEADQLRETSRTLSSVERVARIGSWEVDLVEGRVNWSDETCRIHEVPDDYEPNLEEGIDFYEQGESREKITAAVQNAIATGEGWDLELSIITAKNNRIWVRAQGEAERLDGKCVRLFGVFQDITERYQYEQALIESKRRTDQLNQELEWKERVFNATQKIANIGSFNTNILTDKQWYSDQLKVIFGYAPDEEFNRDLWLEHVHPDDVQQVIDATTEIFEKKVSTTSYLNYRITTRDGELKWLDVSWSFNFDTNGEATLIEGSVQDVTTKQLAMAHQEAIAEELKEANVKAEAASAMKSEFLANMSHEIRTPMNAVLGLAQVLTREREYPPAVVDHAQKIVRAGQSLQNLLNDILDFSKMESGKLTLSLMPMRLCEIQRNLALLMESSAQDKQIELIIDPPPKSEHALLGDQLRIEQVLINLMGNAIKFTESGFVALKITEIDDPDTENVSQLKFSVVDSGIGMTPEQMQRILEPFSQADASITRRFGGTGLGLTISQRLLELMGSDLEIESEVGKGSVFSFTLTLTKSDIQVLEQPAADIVLKADSLTGKTLLVVDDNLFNRDVAKTIIEGEGAVVVMAEDGEQAVNWLQGEGNVADAVLMDVQMPVLDGLEATRILRTQPRFEGLPIIGMSAGAYQSDIDNALAAGMNAYITKPINIQAALRSLAEQLGLDLTTEMQSAAAESATQPAQLTLETAPLFDESAAVGFWADHQKIASYLQLYISDFNQALSVENAFGEGVSPAELHKLKGSASAIYLQRLRLALAEVETLLKSSEPAEGALARLSEIWQQTLPLITAFIETHAKRETKSESSESSQPLVLSEEALASLKQAISSYNPDDVITALEPLMASHPSAILNEIQDAVLGFDFQKATALVDSIGTK